MKCCLIIPTYRRPEHLKRALDSARAQTRPPDEIIVGVRDTDQATLELLRNYPAPVLASLVSVPGVVASMQAALERSTGDLVAFIDDDVELLPDWFSVALAHITARPRLGLLGGRDLLQDRPDYREAEPRRKEVGIMRWYGASSGNHHCGTGGYRPVDVLKGCNIIGRGDLLRSIGFEGALRGQGAQVNWEVALCLDVKSRGFEVGYDSELAVKHFIAPRFDADVNQRGGYSGEALFDEVFNLHYVLSSRLPASSAWLHHAWTLLRGSHHAPGLVQFLRIRFIRKDPNARDRLRRVFRAVGQGRRAGALRRNGSSI
jgi:glycosyltransferase involved in cell wall biosynthesis